VPRPIYRFGDCRIDLFARELRRAGELVVLSPKVFDCLAYLIERHERAVGRDELVAAVWGKTEITDTLLGQTILKARRAVGDNADEQNVIRTIPRFGYTWVAALGADVAVLAPDQKENETSPAPLPSPGRRGVGDRRIVWFAISVVAAAAVFGIWIARPVPSDTAAPTSANSAAVLPVDVTAPEEWSWVRLGLMDAIATRLRQGDQPVVPSNNVIALARAAGSEGDDKRTRDATGAKFLIVPSAAWSSSGWNVHLELRGGEAPRSVDARNADVLLAGREAADRLLALIGKRPPADAGDTQQWSDAKLLQRAEAALLTDDLDGARRLLQSAPASLQKSPELLLRLAKIDFRAGKLDAADQRLRTLLAAMPAETDPVLRARILNGLGHVAMRLGRTDAAEASYAEAVSLLEDRNEPAELGQAYMGRGTVAETQGRHDAALAAFSQAHIAFELAGDRLALARLEANEGMLDASRGQFAAAAPTLERAAQRFESFGTSSEMVITTNAEIGARLALLEPKQALAASDRAWPVRDRLENPRIRNALSINRALALDATGRRQDAMGLLRDVIRTADPERERIVLAVARAELARIELVSGHVAAAIELALLAIPALEQTDDARDRLGAWLVGTRSLRAAGRVADAAEQVGRLTDWAKATAQPAAMLYASLARAEQLVAERQRTPAYSEYDRALELAAQGSVPADIAEVATSYGTALLAEGQLERATAVVGQAARWADRDFGCALLQARLYKALGQRQAWETALAHARALAGDREIPRDVADFPDPSAVARLP
jgi:DNA-binding winged helix-turn-helix (wHTH) protein/tetratricopeptide (TPR) repeat protein